ncbi:MAG: PilZ domain-containing protein [Vulcanimicrobiota bacterium]
MANVFNILQRLFRSDRCEKRADPRQPVFIPVRALVGVELKQGHLEDLSSRGARICLEGLKRAPAWVDLQCVSGIQRGLVRWSRLRDGGRWEGGIEFEHALA